MVSTVCMPLIYDNRILRARVNTAFALDATPGSFHECEMENAAEIRAALKAKLDAREITQKEIGNTLGIQQPNVATLFSPGKNGKLRGIDFDEGVKLIQRFRLDGTLAGHALPSADVLTTAFVTLLDSVGIAPYEDEHARKLALRFPDALRRAEGFHAGRDVASSQDPAEASPDPDEDRPSA
jgi:predicted XRE-type DNA-binding protein